MLFHWRRWVLYPEERSGPSASPCTGCLYLQMSTKQPQSKYINRVNWRCLRLEHICEDLFGNLDGPFAEERRLLTPQSPRETSSRTCGHRSVHSCYLAPVYVPDVMTRTWLGAPSHLWQSSPMPSSGCRTPVEDSPWARKNTAGRYFDKACGEQKKLLSV